MTALRHRWSDTDEDVEDEIFGQVRVHSSILRSASTVFEQMLTDADALQLIPLAHYYQMGRPFRTCVDRITQALSLESYV